MTLLGLWLLLGSAAPAWANAAPACSAWAEPGDDLQAAIDALAARSPAVLCLKAGDYPLYQYLAIRRHRFTLRGAGPGSVLRLQHQVESPVIVIGDDSQREPGFEVFGVALEQLSIIGGGHGGSEHHPQRPWLTNSGVVVRRGNGIRIEYLDVQHCRSAGILTEYNSAQVTIAHNRVGYAAWDGISLNRASRTVISHNLLQENLAAGLTTEHLTDSQITDNQFTFNGSHGIYLADAYRNRVANNRFERHAGAGIYLTCSIRSRDPVRCWDRSMSAANVFDANLYLNNRLGYQFGVDDAANCRSDGFVTNRSSGERFVNTLNERLDAARYGLCVGGIDEPPR